MSLLVISVQKALHRPVTIVVIACFCIFLGWGIREDGSYYVVPVSALPVVKHVQSAVPNTVHKPKEVLEGKFEATSNTNIKAVLLTADGHYDEVVEKETNSLSSPYDGGIISVVADQQNHSSNCHYDGGNMSAVVTNLDDGTMSTHALAEISSSSTLFDNLIRVSNARLQPKTKDRISWFIFVASLMLACAVACYIIYAPLTQICC
eukprot:gnl/MRDRNA2_/MRDRNA2_77731_c0_seq2.p1 gnl/MRDRNA2_/MRDRNA2_77731_c0~~gnl/MRDRNA2_/MRDRNA2_77731_c0_seq2.p1  ORF type:complete len:206 (+),score=20.87 gnl/MRDRNA2_/MRDRNA2_77731_c0_seq2:219-836(+)